MGLDGDGLGGEVFWVVRLLRSCSSRTGRKVRARQELEVPGGLGRFP